MGVWGWTAQEYGSHIGPINSLGALAAIPFGGAIGIPFAVAHWSPYTVPAKTNICMFNRSGFLHCPAQRQWHDRDFGVQLRMCSSRMPPPYWPPFGSSKISEYIGYFVILWSWMDSQIKLDKNVWVKKYEQNMPVLCQECLLFFCLPLSNQPRLITQ